MTLRLGLLVLLPLALVLAACPPPEQAAEPDTTEADIAAIETIPENYVAMNNAGDVEALAALFTADAIQMPAGAPPLVGIEALRTNLEAFAGGTELTATLEESQVSGDLGFIRGIYTLTATSEEGETTEEYGKWMAVVQRHEDGSWRILRNIWNTNTSAPPFGSAATGTE